MHSEELERCCLVGCPVGEFCGPEYLAINTQRADRSVGSFSINRRTGRWADFATGDRGGDLISLRAFLNGLNQSEATRQLALEVGHDVVERALLPGAVSPDLTTNCTLEDYAAAKNLPVSFLRELKLETIPNPFDPRRLALRFRYRDADGMVVRDRMPSRPLEGCQRS